MPSTSKVATSKLQKLKKRVVVSGWLIMALAMGAITLILWPLSKTASYDEDVEEVPKPAYKSAAQELGQISHISQLGELDSIIKPVSFDALVRDMRNYPPEFKDSQYLKKNKGKWTVQVMDVSEHQIITDYLNERDDRKKFAYFRYRDENNQPRYVLTYGAMKTPQMAMGAAKTVDFKLPANIRVLPEEIAHYIDIIENYEISEPLQDLSSDRARKVKLQPTKRELAAKRRAKPTKPASNGDGNSSNTAQSSEPDDNVEQPKPATEVDTAIKGSNDTTETISVQEKRQVINPNNSPDSSSGETKSPKTQQSDNVSSTPSDAVKASNNRSTSAGNNQQDRPQTNTPEPSAPPRSNVKESPPPAATSNEADSIRQLIEDKTQ